MVANQADKPKILCPHSYPGYHFYELCYHACQRILRKGYFFGVSLRSEQIRDKGIVFGWNVKINKGTQGWKLQKKSAFTSEKCRKDLPVHRYFYLSMTMVDISTTVVKIGKRLPSWILAVLPRFRFQFLSPPVPMARWNLEGGQT